MIDIIIYSLRQQGMLKRNIQEVRQISIDIHTEGTSLFMGYESSQYLQ